MPVFTPPTYATPAVGAERHPGDRLFRHYTWRSGYTVLIVGGVATEHPGIISPAQSQIDAADDGSGAGGKAAFLGGHVWTVTAAERTILETAGYTVEDD